jgi:hypothetical protein
LWPRFRYAQIAITGNARDEIRQAIAQVEDSIRSMGSQKSSKSTLAQHKRGDGLDPATFPWLEQW